MDSSIVPEVRSLLISDGRKSEHLALSILRIAGVLGRTKNIVAGTDELGKAISSSKGREVCTTRKATTTHGVVARKPNEYRSRKRSFPNFNTVRQHE